VYCFVRMGWMLQVRGLIYFDHSDVTFCSTKYIGNLSLKNHKYAKWEHDVLYSKNHDMFSASLCSSTLIISLSFSSVDQSFLYVQGVDYEV
jgi:hypothetical protein